jgi:hypothetical protein
MTNDKSQMTNQTINGRVPLGDSRRPASVICLPDAASWSSDDRAKSGNLSSVIFISGCLQARDFADSPVRPFNQF